MKIMKYFYDTRRDSYRFSEEPVAFFINVGFQVTRKCNLGCLYCSEAGAMPDASFDEIKLMIDKLVKNGLKRICITGGEPLLRSDLEEILSYIKAKGVNITLSTNGYFLNKYRLEKLKPLIDNIRFSLRGTKEEHNKITGNKLSFDKTIEAMCLSRNVGLPISVVMTVISQNCNQMASVARLCEENGVEKLYFFSLIPRGRAIKVLGKENVAIDKISREHNKVMELSRKENWVIDIKMANFTIEGECVLVFPDGRVVGVPSFVDQENQMVLGNLLKDDPILMWKKYPFKENYINYYHNH
jgi:MoaA/NifB/PqqE/SkfB family radical SAM enzyme